MREENEFDGVIFFQRICFYLRKLQVILTLNSSNNVPLQSISAFSGLNDI